MRADRRSDGRQSSSLRAPNAFEQLHMDWLESCKQVKLFVVVELIEIRGSSLQSCACPYDFSKTIKYNVKGRMARGERAGPRARQEVGRAGPSAEQGGEVNGPRRL